MSLKVFQVRGFSLMELVLVLAMVAILVSLAWPHLGNARQRADVMEAMAGLQQLAVHQEQFRAQQGGYTQDLNLLPEVDSRDYVLSITSADQTSFLLTAISLQTDPADPCRSLTLDHHGRRGPERCW